MHIREILKVTPESLAETQHKQLKEYIINVLTTVLKLIENEDYDTVSKYTNSSPAGDGYGLDNDFIDFKLGDQYGTDILSAVSKLKSLKTISKETRE